MRQPGTLSEQRLFIKLVGGTAAACRSHMETGGLMLELEKKLFPKRDLVGGF